MISHGSAHITLTYKHMTTPIEAIATEGMEQNMLICYTDLVKMKILHPNFPKEVCNSAQGDPLKGPMEALMNEFSDIFDDGDEVLKPMAGPPMQIHLKKGPITPARTLTARRIPILQEKAANETIQSLLKAGIIRQVYEPMEWISPALFVAKPNGKVQLVTDYRQLNKCVNRPMHPFPSATEFTSSIPPGTKWFVKLDAKNGYFQLLMDEASMALTTFIVPQGWFQYCRAPMGLCSSGDEYCACGDTALRDIQGIKKIIDDILIHAKSIPELLDTVRQVFE